MFNRMNQLIANRNNNRNNRNINSIPRINSTPRRRNVSFTIGQQTSRLNQLQRQVQLLSIMNKRNNQVKRRRNTGPPMQTSVAPPVRLARQVRTMARTSAQSKPMARKVQAVSKGENSLSQYVSCRLNPFSAMGSLGIPDDCGYRRIVVDYRAFTDITFSASSQLNILLMPMLPSPVFLKATVDNAVTFTYPSGGNITIAQGAANTTYQNGWIPAMIFPELQASAGIGLTPSGSFSAGNLVQVVVPNPYSADKGRLVTMCHRLVYTGTANNCSGTITASDIPFQIAGVPSSSPFSIIPVSQANVGGTQANYATANININITPGLFSQDTISHRPEIGDVVLAKHSGKYQFKPWYNTPFHLVNGNTAQSSAEVPFTGFLPSLASGGIMFYDDQWSGTLLTVNGTTAGNTYRLESYFCIEYTPDQGSAFMRLAKDVPAVSSNLIDRVSDVAKQIPTTVSIAQGTEPWYIKAAKIAGAVGRAALGV
jgi:hypothetical protein